MKLSTSTRISLGFSLLSILILGMFSFAIYYLFDTGRHRSEQKLLIEEIYRQPGRNQQQDVSQKNQGGLASNKKYKPTQSFLLTSEDTLFTLISGLDEQQGFFTYEEMHYVYIKKQDQIFLKDVTQHTERQEMLLNLLIFSMLGGALLSFFFGKLFVNWALRDLHTLSKKVEDIDVHMLDFQLQFDHLPENDPLAVLSQTLTRMTQKIHEQVHDIKSFVANAAHELRTPLMVMRSSAELALKTKSYEEYIQQIQGTIGQMEGLISTLLLMARSETNGFQKELSNPQEIILTGIHQLKKKRSEKNIEISYTGKAKDILMHAGSFERIFHNIVDNAFAYTPVGGKIRIVLEDTMIHIIDTGRGIAADDLQHIWKPFWQADASRGQDIGFGLGLALVKRLVDLHGWTIEVVSEIGVGTEVKIIW